MAMPSDIERALDVLQSAQRPLALIGQGMASSQAEEEVRAFIEKTQIPFVRTPKGKGVLPDDHPLSAGAARSLALLEADVVFLMGARFNWILHFGLPPRYNKDVRVVQLDIEPEAMHQNKPAEVALVGDGKAIVAQLNQALAGRQWFHPEGSPWRQAIAKKSAENAAMIAPQVDDDSAPGGYYRLFRDIREWLPKNVVLCSEGATTMDIGGTQMPLENPRSYLNAGSYGTMGVGLGLVVASCVVHPDRPVVHVSGDSAIGFSGMEMETLCRYNMPAKIVVLNNGGIGPGMPEIPANPMLNMRPNTLIYGARYDKMMQAFGGYGAYVEDTKDFRGALDELMNFPGPGLVVKLSLGLAQAPAIPLAILPASSPRRGEALAFWDRSTRPTRLGHPHHTAASAAATFDLAIAAGPANPRRAGGAGPAGQWQASSSSPRRWETAPARGISYRFQAVAGDR